MEYSSAGPLDILEEMAAIANSIVPAKNPEPAKSAHGVVPSPRGIQDILFDFPTGCSNHGNNFPTSCAGGGNGDQTDVSAPVAHNSFAASHHGDPRLRPQAAATFLCSNVKTSLTLTTSPDKSTHYRRLSVTSSPGEQPSLSQSPPLFVVPPSSFAQDPITPWLDDCSPETEKSIPSVGLDVPRSTAGVNLSYSHDSRVPHGSRGAETGGTAPFRVMPPTAKSILERRERAIREGRRHEAKLNSEERRILRRLRNRESAERCARRKLEEAEQLANKISDLERENLRLRLIATQYENEVFELEHFLVNSNSIAQHSAKGQKRQ
jgi:bZIP transcription factor